ncbi:MAG: tetratricopeptide repeat protein [Candidatus Omnitrophica bacterium]|nr:tetratricopeptide repeat protein [Candidatus Omnitrophota bacterium]
MLKTFLSICILISCLFLVFPVYGVMEEEALSYRQEGYELQTRGDLKGALSSYLKATQMNPFYKEAYNDAGVVYETMGDLDRAEVMYLKAIEIDPNYLAPYSNLGFLYEKRNQPLKATHYWKKRYLMGKKGGYWRQKAREHLIKLGTYPQARQEELAEEAEVFSRNMAVLKEEERLRVLQEAKMHFEAGLQAFSSGLYKEAIKEFEAVVLLQPSDETLIAEATKYQNTAREGAAREEIKAHLNNSLSYLDRKDYLSLMQELRKALTLVPEVPRE